MLYNFFRIFLPC